MLMLVALLFAATGCGYLNKSDADVDSFIEEDQAMNTAICSKIEADPSEAGADAAIAVFEEHRASLKTKFDALSARKPDEMSPESIEKLKANAKTSANILRECFVKNRSKLEASGAAWQKLTKLVDDLGALFAMPK